MAFEEQDFEEQEAEASPTLEIQGLEVFAFASIPPTTHMPSIGGPTKGLVELHLGL